MKQVVSNFLGVVMIGAMFAAGVATAAQTGVAISAVAPNVETTIIEGSATISEPNGEYTLVDFRRVTMPTLVAIRLATTSTAGNGAFVGDYWAANAHGIKFQLMRTQADWPNVALEVGTASGQRWYFDGFDLSGDQNVWIEHSIPLNYEAGWQSTGNTTPEGWAAARANVEWIGVSASQRGTSAQAVAVNGFELLNSVPGWDHESPPDGAEPDPEPSLGVLVSNISASQRPGTKLMDIVYDLANTESSTVSVSLAVKDGDTVIASPTVTGDVGAGVVVGTGKSMVWNMETDWNGNVALLSYTVTATEE